jgi:hypothetical protein
MWDTHDKAFVQAVVANVLIRDEYCIAREVLMLNSCSQMSLVQARQHKMIYLLGAESALGEKSSIIGTVIVTSVHNSQFHLNRLGNFSIQIDSLMMMLRH